MDRKVSLYIIIFLGVSTALTTFVYNSTQQADINYYNGHRLFVSGIYEKAIPFYEKSISENPHHEKALKEFAYSCLWTGQTNKAINLLEAVASKEPDNLEVKASLAEAYSWDKKYAASITLFREIILGTNSPWAKEKLAEVYLWSGQPEKAKVILELLLERYPDSFKVKLLWGKALYYTGESEKASRVFEQLLQNKEE